MEIDPKVLPDHEATEPVIKEIPAQSPKAEDDTSKNEAPEELKQELESLKTKNLELQEQKKHWRDKYERDITNKPSAEDDEFLSDEGKVLTEKMKKLEQQLITRQKQDEETRLYSLYPALKDKQEEFKEFLEDPDNAGIKLDKAAKLFLVEKGLLETPPKRIGLERGTSGSKTPSSGLSIDDIRRLREGQPRRYQQMLRDGRIDPTKIV